MQLGKLPLRRKTHWLQGPKNAPTAPHHADSRGCPLQAQSRGLGSWLLHSLALGPKQGRLKLWGNAGEDWELRGKEGAKHLR